MGNPKASTGLSIACKPGWSMGRGGSASSNMMPKQVLEARSDARARPTWGHRAGLCAFLKSLRSIPQLRTERLHFPFSLSCIGEGNGNPLQCPCLENPRDGGAWWAAVCGVAQSRTRLKRLSSSSKGNSLSRRLPW